MTQVTFQTNMGDITIEVDHENAPIGAENFVHYAMDGFYNGTIFHRIIPGFMVQGGGMLPGMEEKPSGDPIENEADNGKREERQHKLLPEIDLFQCNFVTIDKHYCHNSCKLYDDFIRFHQSRLFDTHELTRNDHMPC